MVSSLLYDRSGQNWDLFTGLRWCLGVNYDTAYLPYSKILSAMSELYELHLLQEKIQMYEV